MCFQGLLFLGKITVLLALAWKVCLGVGGFLWFGFVFISSTILLYLSSSPDQGRPVLVTFINGDRCFWMGWFNIAANVRKSQTIMPPHCANNSHVPFFWQAMLLLVAASGGITGRAARSFRISAFYSLLSVFSHTASFLTSWDRTIVFFTEITAYFLLVSTNSNLELWKKGEDGAFFGGGGGTQQPQNKQPLQKHPTLPNKTVSVPPWTGC